MCFFLLQLLYTAEMASQPGKNEHEWGQTDPNAIFRRVSFPGKKTEYGRCLVESALNFPLLSEVFLYQKARSRACSAGAS